MFSVLAASLRTHVPPFTVEETAPSITSASWEGKNKPRRFPGNLQLSGMVQPNSPYFTLEQLISYKSSVTDSKGSPQLSGQPASMPLPRAGAGALPISPGTRLPLKRKHAVTLRQLTGCKPSWHWGAVILMEAGRKMEMSMVMTGLDLEINREVEVSDNSKGSDQPKENNTNLVTCTVSSKHEK